MKTANVMSRKLANLLARNHSLFSVFNSTIFRAVDYVRFLHQQAENERIGPRLSLEEAFIMEKIPELIVRSGPFRGMRYPAIQSIGSTLAPKLIGCYEKELHSVIEYICSHPYSSVVDIGCAEGYYAVGLAMRLPNVQVHAYDTNPEATRLCVAMAKLNGVSNRLSTGSFCSAETLEKLELGSNALILSDCEGFEMELFDEQLSSLLEPHDLLIELHDFIDIAISAKIKKMFAETHDVYSVFSVDDIQKAHMYSYCELDGYSLDEKKALLAEWRPAVMEWVYLTSRKKALKY